MGYSTGAALADIIDNSISAGARNVWLEFRYDGPASTISALDDGAGMNEGELRNAMVLGAKSPLSTRSSSDLGRFGLGLKTASFSQCRCLTVASRKSDQIAVRRWDLDHIAEKDNWCLLTSPRFGSEPHLGAVEQLSSGTIVLWEVLDRLTAQLKRGDRRSEQVFFSTAEQVENHLATVFHQYLEGSDPPLRIHFNGRRIKAWDPFLRSHRASEPTPSEMIQTATGMVELQGFILPHKDQLSEKEFELGGGSDGWAALQGFYLYRGKRLLVAGGWLGLGTPRPWTMEEPYRLARLRVEFENTADSEWDIDVKKSIARPPRQLRPRMTELAQLVRTRARNIFAHRGGYKARTGREEVPPVWLCRDGASGPRYGIDREHPAITALLSSSDCEAATIESALRLIEATVPIERIWLDTAEMGEVMSSPKSGPLPPEFAAIAQCLIAHWTSKLGLSIDDAFEKLSRTDPFQNYQIARDELLNNSG